MDGARATTVEQPIDEIATTAVEALCALMESPHHSLPNYVFRPQLRVGPLDGLLNGRSKANAASTH